MDGFIEQLKKYNLSCGGFYLSSGYTSIGKQRFVFNWNKDKFPDIKKFVSDFSDKGITLIPNIKPAFLINHPLYKEIADKDLFVKNAGTGSEAILILQIRPLLISGKTKLQKLCWITALLPHGMITTNLILKIQRLWLPVSAKMRFRQAEYGLCLPIL